MLIIVRLLVCASIAVAAASAQESLSEWPRLNGAATIHYRTTTNITQEMLLGSRKTEQAFEVHTDETHVVSSAGLDGAIDVSITRTRIWGTVRGSTFQGAISFDTDEGGGIHPFAKSLVDTLQPRTAVMLDRTGKVLSVRKALKNGEFGEPIDHERETTQFSFIRAPQLPIVVGASWLPDEGVHECGTSGCIELVTSNQLTTLDEHSLTVVTVAADEHAEGVEPIHRVERTLSLSRRDGCVLDLQASGTSRSPGLERSLSYTMQRVPEQTESKGPERDTSELQR